MEIGAQFYTVRQTCQNLEDFAVTLKKVADIGYRNVQISGTCPYPAEWLKEHCWDYGFILRYNKDKESITGFLAEPWHFRYVGIEHAKIMQDENLCLEEYLEEYTKDIMV